MAKTIWLHQEDLKWFVEALHLEVYRVEAVVSPQGIRWLEGKHAWVANWTTASGDHEETVYVNPWMQTKKVRMPMEEQVFQAKKKQKREELQRKIAEQGFIDKSEV